MLRIFLVLATITAAASPAWAANFWLSSIGNVGTASAPPTTLSAIETIPHQPSATSGTFYVWGRPTANKTLENWSLKVISSNTNIVSFNTSSVESYNPMLGNNGDPIVRWEFVGEPTGPNVSSNGLKGLNVFGVDRLGIGVGPASDGLPTPGADQYLDPLFSASKNAWLLASVNYSLHGALGQAAIHLQIGDIGLNYAGEGSAAANAVFGLTGDPALNGDSQRNTSSATADLFISVFDTPLPNANFDSDGDVDGRDFLIWQRSYGITSGATHQQGDANHDQAVNGADLAIWRGQYGQSQLLANLSTSIPETATAVQLIAVAFASCFRYSRCGHAASWGRQATDNFHHTVGLVPR